MKRILALLLALCSLPALGLPRAVPVSQAEAAAVFTKTEQVIRGVLQLKGKAPAFPSSATVATREQILKHFSAIYDLVQPKFKFTPKRQKSAAHVLTIKNPQVKQAALKLEVMGFVDRYGPLATSKSDGLQPGEFGDALGYFLARIAELTHTPSSKFSPYLMPG